MELIPIIAFICLVVAFSVFILSIGAYFIEKHKSKHKKELPPKEEYIHAKLIVPVEYSEPTRESRIEIQPKSKNSVVILPEPDVKHIHPFKKNIQHFR